MKRPPAIFYAVLALAGCDPEPTPEDSSAFRGGEALECIAPDELYEPIVDDFATRSAPGLLEPHAGVEIVVDEKHNAVYLDNGDKKTYVCRCASGCGGSACEMGVGPIVATCTGECEGAISGDGEPCWGCDWHEAAASDPGDGTELPPIDVPPGELDPGDGGPWLPPIDLPPGELDPTF